MIMRNWLMGNVCWDATSDAAGGAGGKTPAQIEREKIVVTKAAVVEPEVKEGEEQSGDTNTNGEGDDEGNGEGKEGEETEGEEAKEGEEVEAKVDDPEKLKRTIARLQKRIDKQTGTNKTLEKELNDAKTKLEAKLADGEVGLTEDDVEKRAEEKAAIKTAEREFTSACNRLADGATKIDKDFAVKVNAMSEDIGKIPSQMIGILDDLDNGPAVLTHLVNNVEDAEEIYGLSIPKMSIKLAKLSEKLITENKNKKNKEISNVPKPNAPIGGGSATPPTVQAALAGSNGVITREKMENFNRIRAQQVAERQKARMGGSR